MPKTSFRQRVPTLLANTLPCRHAFFLHSDSANLMKILHIKDGTASSSKRRSEQRTGSSSDDVKDGVAPVPGSASDDQAAAMAAAAELEAQWQKVRAYAQNTRLVLLGDKEKLCNVYILKFNRGELDVVVYLIDRRRRREKLGRRRRKNRRRKRRDCA